MSDLLEKLVSENSLPDAAKGSGKVVLVINVKGGIGKTTSIINMGSGLRRKGYKVALVDNDPQASTSGFLEEKYPEKRNIETLFKVAYTQPERLEAAISVVAQDLEGCHGFAPTLQWASFGAKFSDEILIEQFGKIFDAMRNMYDFILVDCPQGGDKNTQAMFCVADGLIIPVQTQPLCFESTPSILSLLDYMKTKKNPELKLYLFLATMFEQKKKNQQKMLAGIRRKWADPRNVPVSVIRKQVAMEEMRMNRKSVFALDAQSYGAEDYDQAINIFLESVKELHNAEN